MPCSTRFLLPGLPTISRVLTRPSPAAPRSLHVRSRLSVLSATRMQHRVKCTDSKPCPSSHRPPQSPLRIAFWSSRPVWRRALINTLRCLVGCTAGDFSAMWYLQYYHPDLGMGSTMAVSSPFAPIPRSNCSTLWMSLLLTEYSGCWNRYIPAPGVGSFALRP